MMASAYSAVKVERSGMYYFQRLLPFLMAHFFFEMLEMGAQAVAGWEGATTWAQWQTPLMEMLTSMSFAILPYLLYLLALPAPFHGGRCDRIVTLCIFVVFCLFNGLEELSEFLSGDAFHLKSIAFLRKPKEVILEFFALRAAIPFLLAVLVIVFGTVKFFWRHMMADEELKVPNAVSRFLFTCVMLTFSFMLNYAVEDISPLDSEPEVYHDGLFSLFGSLVAFTAVPDVGQIYGPCCLWLVVLLGCLALINATISRYFSDKWAPLHMLARGYIKLTDKYGAFPVKLALMLATVLLIRLWALGQYPLMDPTEARYAEMSRKMLETGYWLQPLFDYGVPFWGKPPLSFWCGSFTMWLFGVNEWAARLAPYLASVGTGLVFYAWPFPRHRKSWATACFIVMMTTAMGFVASGAVMTDSFLTLGVALTMVSFRRVMEERASRVWGYLFFVGLAVGLMSKGPLALVLCGAPLFVWICLYRKWTLVWDRIPWIKGGALLLLLTVPWYAAAEWTTPGFLRYFLVGEHFERFVVKGWQGDLYGAGHSRSLGTIWLYALEMFLPWLLLVPFIAFRKVKGIQDANGDREENMFLLLWMFAPLFFFTFARNILPAYVLPGIPAFSLWLVSRFRAYAEEGGRPEFKELVFTTAPIMLLIVFFGLGSGFSYFEYRCHKDFVAAWDGSAPLYYYGDKVAYSGQFYSVGKAQLAPCAPESCPAGTCAIVSERYEAPQAFNSGWKLVGSNLKWRMYVKKPD